MNNKKVKKLFWTVYFGSIISIIFIMFLISVGALGKMPNYNELENPSFQLASEVLSEEGKTLGTYYIENRTFVDYQKLSPFLIDALIATEDVRFHDHSGIDPKGTLRALIFLGKKGGASTISQQLAKMLFHEPSNNIILRIKQKLQEWIIAAQLERRYTKKEIIALYLNKFDFLYDAVGIQSASAVYFESNPENLKLEEAAVFVGMAKNPIIYNPKRNPENALRRRNTVLNQMAKYGYISQHKCDSIKAIPIDLKFNSANHNSGDATYFRQVLKEEVKKLLSEQDNMGNYIIRKPDGSPYNIYTDGLKIHTTINYEMQKHAEEAVSHYLSTKLQKHFNNEKKRNFPFSNKIETKQVDAILWKEITQSARYKQMMKLKKKPTKTEVMAAFKKPAKMTVFSWAGDKDTTLTPLDSIKYYKSILHAGLMSMNPHSGHVKAWVGGINNKYFQYDHVKQAKRQVGSTFKPILYATAIENELIKPCEEITNMSYYINKGEMGMTEKWEPNYSPKFEGKVTFKYGLANSMNNIAAYLIKKTRPQAVVDKAKAMGIESPLDVVASICLGVSDVSLYEMVGAYSCFANKGVWQKPVYITKITDKEGNILKQFDIESNVALSEETAYTMLKMMQGAADGIYHPARGKKSGTAMSLRSVYKMDFPIAGKTGTTQSSADGWFIGITSDLVTGVWVGAEDRAVRFNSGYFGQGAVMALPIFGLYTRSCYFNRSLNLKFEEFEKPEGFTEDFTCEENSSSQTPDNDPEIIDEEDDLQQTHF